MSSSRESPVGKDQRPQSAHAAIHSDMFAMASAY
jgi:hypothetical protein